MFNVAEDPLTHFTLLQKKNGLVHIQLALPKQFKLIIIRSFKCHAI